MQLDDSAPGILSELLIILTIANQLFEQSSSMSPAAPSALMAALAETSRKILAAVQQQSFAVGAATGAGVTAPGGSLGGVGSPAGSAAGSTSTGTFRLTALSRMVEVLLVNLLRIQVGFFWTVSGSADCYCPAVSAGSDSYTWWRLVSLALLLGF